MVVQMWSIAGAALMRRLNPGVTLPGRLPLPVTDSIGVNEKRPSPTLLSKGDDGGSSLSSEGAFEYVLSNGELPRRASMDGVRKRLPLVPLASPYPILLNQRRHQRAGSAVLKSVPGPDAPLC